MVEFGIPIIAMVTSLVFIPYIIYQIVKVRTKAEHERRMLEIEKGIVSQPPKRYVEDEKVRKSLLTVGIGLGLLLGYILDEAFNMELIGYVSMLCIFIGISKLVYHRMFVKQDEE